MIVATYIPGEVVAAAITTNFAATVALAAALSRCRERVARLEEWVRLHERAEDDATS